MRSLPEKTIEHWVSREIARRFPNVGLWWPSNGEDIMVDEIGGRPGKWFMLEVKTTEWEPAGRNRLTVELEQLAVYLQVGMPVFYVFPVPPWDDVLTSAVPWLGRWRRGDLGNPAAGGQWFAHWTYVLSAVDVAKIIGTSRPTQKSGTLFTSSASTRSGNVPLRARTLNQFLHLQAQCGDPRNRAGIVVPTMAGRPHLARRADLVAQIREVVFNGASPEGQYSHFLPMPGDDSAADYREVQGDDLARLLADASIGSGRLILASIDASDLAVV